MKFKKYKNNPVIPRTPGTFYSKHVANPDILLLNDRYYYYFRGQGKENHDQIGVAFSTLDEFDGINWEYYSENPVIPVGEKGDFDARHVLDPATVEHQGTIYLYYSGHPYQGTASIGLAISKDGINFKKASENSVIKDAIAPEIVIHDNQFYLFYQRSHQDGFFEVFCCPGDDGINFDMEREVRVFGPSNEKDAFDRFSISTVRIWQEGDYYYMTYGGNDKYKDYPCAIGLARSEDLFNWERYPGNPVLTRGEPGSWDEGGVWFATVYKLEDTCYLWYEGTGTGVGNDKAAESEISRLCREADYGGYGRTSFSQIGLATYQGEVPDW